MPPTAVHCDLIQVGLKRGSLTGPFICHSTRLSTSDGADTAVGVGESGRDPRKASPCPHGATFSWAEPSDTPVNQSEGDPSWSYKWQRGDTGLEGAICWFWMMREGISEEGALTELRK